jgi:hypothetical protein
MCQTDWLQNQIQSYCNGGDDVSVSIDYLEMFYL